MIRTSLCISLVLMIVSVEASAQSRNFVYVDGPESIEKAAETGVHLTLWHPEEDTLQVYVQDIDLDDGPNYIKSRGADMVVWCYPQIWRSPIHALPDAEGKVVVRRIGEQVLVADRTDVRHLFD